MASTKDCFPALEAGSPNSRCWQGGFPEAVREKGSPASPLISGGLLATLGIPYFVEASS